VRQLGVYKKTNEDDGDADQDDAPAIETAETQLLLPDGDNGTYAPKAFFLEGDVMIKDAWDSLLACVARLGLQKIMFLTSPPWGMLAEKKNRGEEDEGIKTTSCGLFCKAMFDMEGEDNIVALHLPPFPTAEAFKWHKSMSESGWTPYTSTYQVVCEPLKLTAYSLHQPKRNMAQFQMYHKDGSAPVVTAGFVRDMSKGAPSNKAQHKLSKSLWNTVTIAKGSMKVPDPERVKINNSKDALRVQQLSAGVMQRVIERWGRLIDTQDPVTVIDPFMGCGGTALAARILGCPFVGMDRDPACVEAAEEKYLELEEDEVNQSPH
jgi:hypothetical protein